MEFQKIILKNGLTLLVEQRNLPVVTLLIAAKIGSGNEPASLKGIAHYLEHSLFKGSKKRNSHEIALAIEKIGGKLNGFTAEDATAYWAKIRSNYFEKSLDVLSDMVLNPAFDKKEIEKEKKVILEEIKMCHDTPQVHVINLLKSKLYQGPFSMPGIGTVKTLSSIKLFDLKKFYSFYTPNNIIISAVGKIDSDILNLIKKRFSFRKKLPIKKIIAVKSKGQIIEQRSGLDQSHLALGWHAPPINEKQRYAAEILNAVLGMGMSSRLFEEIRAKRGLAYSIHSHIEQERDYAYNLVYAGIDKKNLGLVKELILKEIKKISSLNNKELEQAKEQLIGQHELTNEQSDAVAVELVHEELSGNAKKWYVYPEKIASVKLSDVKALTKLKSYSFAAIVPN